MVNKESDIACNLFAREAVLEKLQRYFFLIVTAIYFSNRLT